MAGPTTAMSNPMPMKSRDWSRPLANATALGGVEIGKHIAEEHAKAIGRAKKTALSIPTKAIPMGIMMFAVAVLLIKFDSTTARAAKAMTSGKPVHVLGIWVANHAARPVLLMATPSDSPPARRMRTSHGSSRISFAVITPVTANKTMGRKEMTAEGVPCREEVIHRVTVVKKTSKTMIL